MSPAGAFNATESPMAGLPIDSMKFRVCFQTWIDRWIASVSLLGLLIAGLADAAVGQEAGPGGGAKKILIFGDPNPNNPRRQVQLMERSLRLVADAFKAQAYDVDTIPTGQLNRASVRERLAHYTRSLTPEDTFVLYSHSHGGERGTFFLTWSEFAENILAIPAKHVVVFAMSCHSGKLCDALTAVKSKWEGRKDQGRSLVVLTPVSADQDAGPSPEPGIGNPFTYAVTTAAQGAADGVSGSAKDGRIELEELVAYVIRTTREKSMRQSYRPQFAGEFPPGTVFFPNFPPSNPGTAAAVIQPENVRAK